MAEIHEKKRITILLAYSSPHRALVHEALALLHEIPLKNADLSVMVVEYSPEETPFPAAFRRQTDLTIQVGPPFGGKWGFFTWPWNLLEFEVKAGHSRPLQATIDAFSSSEFFSRFPQRYIISDSKDLAYFIRGLSSWYVRIAVETPQGNFLLTVPQDMALRQLMRFIAEHGALSIDTTWQIFRQHERLDPAATLKEAGVENGDFLRFAPEMYAGGDNKVLARKLLVENRESHGSLGRELSGILLSKLEEYTRPERVQFTVMHPRSLTAAKCSKLIAYVHLPSAAKDVAQDAKGRLSEGYVGAQGQELENIKHGAVITVMLSLPGCRIKQPQRTIVWAKKWHGVEFQFRPNRTFLNRSRGRTIEGTVSFYIGRIIVSDVRFEIKIATTVSTQESAPSSAATANPYHAVFVSYSHRDSAIVDELERAYEVLGLDYLRDVRKLRSGEKWNPELLKMIDRADLFQLCWSHAAKRSEYVTQEWRYALTKNRSSFVRPMYWEIPMPQPPPELADINFSFYRVKWRFRIAVKNLWNRIFD